MNRRITFLAVVEAIILLFLIVALFRNGFVLFLGLAVLFSWLTKQTHNRILGVICGVFWLLMAFNLLRSGFFWMAIAFPIVMGLYYYRHRGSNGRDYSTEEFSSVDYSQIIDNELIDLADLHYHPEGNNLTIRKSRGNTKIIVPRGVELALNLKVHTGVVKVFDQSPEINDVVLRYCTPNYESAEKRVAISIQVDTGNVELVRD